MSLQSYIEQNGRFPGVKLIIQTLPRPPIAAQTIELTNFLSYSFESSVITPVDTFNFTFAYPSSAEPFTKNVRPGDLVTLVASVNLKEKIIATGIIDSTEVEVDAERGEIVTVNGRNLLGQLEDQNAVSIYASPVFGKSVPVDVVVKQLLASTRIQRYRLFNFSGGNTMFATDPGESKLDALCRYLESLNCICFMDPDGTLVLGRPNMGPPVVGEIVCDKSSNYSNVVSIKMIDSSAMIPNIIIPMYSGQEPATAFVAKQQHVINGAEGPNRLWRSGHIIPKTVITSLPDGASPQGFVQVNEFKALGANRLQGVAKRELMRANFKELQVQAIVPGHYDSEGNPFVINSLYNIVFDRASLRKVMYLYGVSYTLSEGGSQRTSLHFCNTGTIVGDVSAQ